MTEVLFYHLEDRPLESVLPVLLQRALARGWRVVVHTTIEERVDVLDGYLWTFRDDSFLPHGTFRETTAAEQQVLLTVRDDNPNGATVRILIDRAPVPQDVAAYERVVLMFDGGDEAAVAAAREAWQAVKTMGCAASYWRASGDGRWQRRA